MGAGLVPPKVTAAAATTTGLLPPLPKPPKVVYPVPLTKRGPQGKQALVGDLVMVEWKRYDWRVCKVLQMSKEDPKMAMYFVHYMECKPPA